MRRRIARPSRLGPARALLVATAAILSLDAVPARAQLPGMIAGSKFEDTNGNGVRDKGEPTVAGWKVYLQGQARDSALTDAQGAYRFFNLPFGQYVVSEESRAGWTRTFPPDPGYWVVSLDPLTPSRGGVDFGNRRPGDCLLDYQWHPGPGIKWLRRLRYWPNDAQTLRRMRPGDVIAISLYATDQDYLVQTCSGCGEGATLKKWGPYGDKVVYDWTLEGGGPGELILPNHPEKTAVLYRIPKCWSTNGTQQAATVTVLVHDDPTGLKAADAPITGSTVTIRMTQDCSETPGGISVAVTTVDGAEPPDLDVTEYDFGDCKPAPPTWTTLTPITHGEVETTEVPDLCPDYGMLLAVNGGDMDEVELKCVSSTTCTAAIQKVITADPLRYAWLVESGAGTFPLGSTGPVVFLRKSRSEDAQVRCDVIMDSQTQAADPPSQTNPRPLAKARKPKALVAVGDASMWYGVRILDMERAALKAREKYEAAGYEVEENLSATVLTVHQALATACYQSVWIGGHGSSGSIFMAEPPSPNILSHTNLATEAQRVWGCPRQPFVRELVLLGCNTYHPRWTDRLVCGRVHSFNYYLVANLGGQILGRNPYIWERDQHVPPAPHNLAGL